MSNTFTQIESLSASLTDTKPVLVDMKTAAKMCSVSLSLLYRLVETGRTPQPISLSSKKVFSVRQLEMWSLNNCPSRDSEQWQEVLRLEREK